MNTRWFVAAAVAAGLAVAGGPASAQGGVAPASFQLRTVSDLAAVCGARAGETNAEAAIYLCHGFLAGVGQYHTATRRPGTPHPPLYCPPDPPPSINQTAAGFAAWARANPQFTLEPAVDGLIRWAQRTYPCPSR